MEPENFREFPIEKWVFYIYILGLGHRPAASFGYTYLGRIGAKTSKAGDRAYLDAMDCFSS